MVKPIRVEPPKPAKTIGMFLDFQLGFALLRDQRVPFRAKAFALIVSFFIVCLIELFEVPLEEILISVIPVIGFLGDVLFAGLEFILGPILLACWMLPYLVRPILVDQIRHERAGINDEHPIIDV